MTDDRVIAVCAGCGDDIFSGAGVVGDADGGKWHPDCRSVARRQDAEPVKRGPGRPRKQPVEA
jgi:hypothetical protein